MLSVFPLSVPLEALHGFMLAAALAFCACSGVALAGAYSDPWSAMFLSDFDRKKLERLPYLAGSWTLQLLVLLLKLVLFPVTCIAWSLYILYGTIA